MKVRNMLFLLALVLGVLISHLAIFVESVNARWLTPCNNSDECGKIVGWIIDSESNKPVKEEFAVEIFPYFDTADRLPGETYGLKTKTGHFSIGVRTGRYFIAFTPYSEGTKYAEYCNPHFFKQDQMIEVEKGKITVIRKKVREGGYLKLIIVNTNYQKVNFRDYFEKGTVNVWVSNDDNGYGEPAIFQKEELEAGEKTITNLVPGTYRISPYFPEAGYASSKEEYINIESKKISEYRVVIDSSDNTGIQGFVKDKNGAPLKGVEILICQDIENYGIKGFADTISNDGGYYKIIGIEEGIYMLRVECDFKDFYLYNIKITGNQLLSKDIVIDFPTN
jgi:hypothetical protein